MCVCVEDLTSSAAPLLHAPVAFTQARRVGPAGQAPPGLKRNFADRPMDFTIPLHYRLPCTFSLICHGVSLWEVIRIIRCAMNPVRGCLQFRLHVRGAVVYSLSDQRITLAEPFMIHGWHAIILAAFSVHLFPKTFSYWRRRLVNWKRRKTSGYSDLSSALP